MSLFRRTFGETDHTNNRLVSRLENPGSLTGSIDHNPVFSDYTKLKKLVIEVFLRENTKFLAANMLPPVGLDLGTRRTLSDSGY